MSSGTSDDQSAKAYPLWDLPVRIVHWSIVLILPASWWTAEEGYMDVHQWLGLGLLVLLMTRIAWAFVGSPQAQLRDFLRAPGAVLAYLRGAPATTPGHNPLGGWSVLLFWILLAAQVLTGTVSSDDILFDGPFRHVIDSAQADALAAIHEPLFKVLLGMIVLHIGAIVFYERKKQQRLLRPMVFGLAPGRVGTGPARSIFLALGIAALMAALLWWAISAAPEPPSMSYW